MSLPAIPGFKNFSYKILVIWANFVKILQILVHIDFKILEKVLSRIVTPIVGQIFQNFDFRILGENRQVMINHRGGILIFCQILSKLENFGF